MRRNQTRSTRRGVTLIELLVVATIMLTLAAASVPTIKPMMESQVSKRAASTVSTYLERARSRAMTSGRPCGVTFEWFDGTTGPYGSAGEERGSASLVLRQVEVPPFYCGMNVNSTVSVAPDPGYLVDSLGRRVNRVFFPPSASAEETAYWDFYVSNEIDLKIQFEATGAFYSMVKEGAGYYIVKVPGVDLPTYSRATFKVQRDPRATMTAPVGLAQGAVVDLEFSGTDSTPFVRGRDVTVMFAPSGEVDYVLTGGEKVIPSDTLYFLVGRWDRIAALGAQPRVDFDDSMAEDGLWNFEDSSNFWVTINPKSGLVSTVEVDQPMLLPKNLDATNVVPDAVFESRDLARRSQRNVGGH